MGENKFKTSRAGRTEKSLLQSSAAISFSVSSRSSDAN